jgi:predicted Zn-dependent protease
MTRAEIARLLAGGDIAAAVARLRAEAAARPDDMVLLERATTLLARSGAAAEALAMVDAALVRQPGRPELLVMRAAALGSLRDFAEALATLAPLEGVPHPPPGLHAIRGKLHDWRGDVSAAATDYAAALAREPRNHGLRTRLARALRRLGRHAEVLELTEAGLGSGAPAAEMLGERATALIALRQVDAAEDALARCAAAGGHAAQVAELRAALAEARGDHAAAAGARAELLAAAPGEAKAVARLLRSLDRVADPGVALRAIEAACAARPDEPALALRLAAQLRRAGRIEQAGAVLAALAAARPGDPEVALALAELAEARDSAEAALDVLRPALADGAAMPEMLRLPLARLLRRTGAAAEALEVLAGAPEKTPALCLEHGECLLDLGRLDELAALLAATPDRTGLTPGARLELAARLASERMDHAAAAGLWQQLAALRPDSRRVRERLGEALLLAFRAEEALPVLAGANRAADGRRLRSLHGGAHGQLLNEMRLRPRVTRALAASMALPPADRADIGAECVLADPQATTPALALIGALAGLGRCAGAPVAGAAIPAVLHRYWDTETPPPDVARAMARLARLHPDHRCQRWSDRTARAFLAARAPAAVLAAYRVAGHAAMRSDIFRLAVLVEEGGIYVDADDVARAPLGTLVAPGATLVLPIERTGAVGNHLIAAAPGQPLLRAALEEAAEAVLSGARESAWLVSGPGVLTRLLARAVAESGEAAPPPGLRLLRRAEIAACLATGRPMAYKRGAGHWSAMAA